MTIDKLKDLIASGKFHHSTTRTEMARGLHIYAKPPPGYPWGFEYVGMFSDSDPATLDQAYAVLREMGAGGSYEGSYR